TTCHGSPLERAGLHRENAFHGCGTSSPEGANVVSPHTRRQFLGGLLTAAALAPVRALAAAVKPVTIQDVAIFPIEIPVTAAERHASYDHRFMVVKIETSAGVRGYSFAGPPTPVLADVRKVLLGRDLFAIERHLEQGLIRWGGVEHALWDAIGKIA